MFSKSMWMGEGLNASLKHSDAWGGNLSFCTTPQSKTISICTTALYSAWRKMYWTLVQFSFHQCSVAITTTNFLKDLKCLCLWQMHATAQYVTCWQTLSHLRNENIYLFSFFSGFKAKKSWQNANKARQEKDWNQVVGFRAHTFIQVSSYKIHRHP